MARGGARLNSGPVSKWKHGKTTTIRVPIALSKRLLEIAKILDQGGEYPPQKRSPEPNFTGDRYNQLDLLNQSQNQEK
jgi:hypothetical protein